ncbi:MAG: response regulator [Symploca sp. SIO1B1]|nr:response regulator [Symploca sp. SIO1C2]NER99314.1 response regulator [Symploca sp. SIO1B1]
MSVAPIKVLLVEDDQGEADELSGLLMQAVHSVPMVITQAQQLSLALEQLTQTSFDIVLLDITLGEGEKLSGFEQIHTKAPTVPIIILSGFQDATLAIEAVRRGAQDYLVKGQIDSPLLVRSIRYGIERQRLLLEVQQSRWQQQQERELLLLEQFPANQSTAVASKLYGSLLLRESVPDKFNQLVQQYANIMDLALEQRIYRVTHPISEQLREVAQQLGFLKASPKDVINIHTNAIKQKISDVPPAKAQAYIEESRIMVLELMGCLVSYYRKYHLAFSQVQHVRLSDK